MAKTFAEYAPGARSSDGPGGPGGQSAFDAFYASLTDEEILAFVTEDDDAQR